MSKLSPELQLIIAQWKEDGILIPVISVPTELILVTCGDGDAGIPDFYRGFARHSHPGQKIRHHLFTNNGGYLDTLELAISHATQSIGLKGIHQIVVCGHAPCSMANHLQLEPEDQIQAQKEAVIKLRAGLNGQTDALQIHSHFHVNWGSNNFELLELQG